MFAQIKKGKLVRLTLTAEDGVELMEKGEIDGLHIVANLDDIARVLKESTPTSDEVFASIDRYLGDIARVLKESTPTSDEVFASIDRYMNKISASINQAADAMEKEFSKAGGLKNDIEACSLKVKNAGEAALRGLRRTVEDIKKSRTTIKHSMGTR